MASLHKQRGNERDMHQESNQYAVVVATELEDIEIVLHGLSASRAEQLATRKNREISGESSIHAIPEKELDGTIDTDH